MATNIQDTEIAEMAAYYINSTDRSIFLTGKAGSGKTAFLTKIVAQTHKNTIVTAPTGVAAINARGITLHSLFQIPFGVFLPSDEASDITDSIIINTPKRIKTTLRINGRNQLILKKLELLIIDEVSMLRADVLDCINVILQHVRNNTMPFGGVQILFIGDLLQLPPVIKNEEKQYLNLFYKTHFFFDAWVLRHYPPMSLELNKIFRQSDRMFIDLLNRLRINKISHQDIDTLNSFYREKIDFSSQGCVLLTTHNKKANQFNEAQLKQIASKSHIFKAVVKGTFEEKNFPAESTIELKIGAQVMFVRNDVGTEKRYYNGKIGKVTSFTDDGIYVLCENEKNPILVAKHVWENVRPTLTQTNEIVEEVIGSFEQYPLRLAWAFTIHKSQGLTFEKLILDPSDAFASGQLYVALSRLTKLDGLILTSKFPDSITPYHSKLLEFENTKPELHQIKEELAFDQKTFHERALAKAFSLSDLLEAFSKCYDMLKKSNLQITQKFVLENLFKEFNEHNDISKKFLSQITTIFRGENYLSVLAHRISKANVYFSSFLKKIAHFVKEAEMELKNSDETPKKEIEVILEFNDAVIAQYSNIHKMDLYTNKAAVGKMPTKAEYQNIPEIKNMYAAFTSKENHKEAQIPKQEKSTYDITLEMFRKGMSIAEIAKERDFSVSTITNHFERFVENGDVFVSELMKQKDLSKILRVAKKETELKSIFVKLKGTYSYNEIKIVLAHLRNIEKSRM